MRQAWVIAALLASATAYGQGADVAAQIKVIETQPAGMDKATWKDQRRDAARKLGQSKDKRAVPVLIKLADSETFDIIGEIAIEALGNIGDAQAAPALQKIAADPARDKATRELARKALGKLGSAAPAPAPTPTSTPTPEATPAPAPTPEAAPASTILGDTKPATDRPALPVLPDDALAAYERLTLAGGTASLGYDSVRKRADFDANASGRYQKRIERQRMAWGVDLGADVVAGYINPDGPAVSRGLQLALTGVGEARLYSGQLYGIGVLALGAQFNYVADVTSDPNNTLKDTRFQGDAQVAVGGGWGRVLDVGAQIRVRRLARVLEAGHALGKPIDAATAKKLQLTWWALRGERSTWRALVDTVAILREAGVLLGEPDAGLSYELLTVLRDSQLYLRPSGLDVQLTISEGYLQRPDQPPANEHGRVEQLLARASYGSQLADDKLEVAGGAYGRLRLFAPDDQPSPWAVGGNVRMRRFAYGEHGDPLGAFDLGGTLEVSEDDRMDDQLGQRITGQLGFTWWVNQASGLRLAASVGEDRGAVFLGAELSATYGFLDGVFAQ